MKYLRNATLMYNDLRDDSDSFSRNTMDGTFTCRTRCNSQVLRCRPCLSCSCYIVSKGGIAHTLANVGHSVSCMG